MAKNKAYTSLTSTTSLAAIETTKSVDIQNLIDLVCYSDFFSSKVIPYHGNNRNFNMHKCDHLYIEINFLG